MGVGSGVRQGQSSQLSPEQAAAAVSAGREELHGTGSQAQAEQQQPQVVYCGGMANLGLPQFNRPCWAMARQPAQTQQTQAIYGGEMADLSLPQCNRPCWVAAQQPQVTDGGGMADLGLPQFNRPRWAPPSQQQTVQPAQQRQTLQHQPRKVICRVHPNRRPPLVRLAQQLSKGIGSAAQLQFGASPEQNEMRSECS